MKINVLKCDICKRNIEPVDHYKMTLAAKGGLKKGCVFKDKFDICPTCYADIRSVIHSMMGEEVMEEYNDIFDTHVSETPLVR